MARYTMKDTNGRYYIESVNGKLESDIKGYTYGEAIDRFAELENADVVPRIEVEVLCTKIRHLEEDYANLVTNYIFAKQEVARAIIDETFKMFDNNFVNTPIYKVAPSKLKAELENKYIGG